MVIPLERRCRWRGILYGYKFIVILLFLLLVFISIVLSRVAILVIHISIPSPTRMYSRFVAVYLRSRD